MAADDCTLVHNVLNGNRQAFDVLAGRYMPRIFQLAYRFFNSRQQAEDIVQDILLQAYQSLGTYSRERPFISWLTTIAVRRCYRELRLRSKRSETALPELSGRERECVDQCCLHAPARIEDPETSLIARDITARLLGALSPREQMVLTLRDVEGLSLRETAGMMGISHLHVKVISHRARKHARDVLATMMLGNAPRTRFQEKRS